mmetsp:Transcript_44873/g.85787  ORF Transcript_44873/g.85787 Transcript_44873/m.85787 type:complete len:171 (+) Transcript_44873:384-896(+)
METEGELVGSIDGIEVGVDDAIAEGELVGDPVGAEVGANESVTVGVLVGAAVGADVGVNEGATVGEKVGAAVGVDVGVDEGATEGEMVGFNVGVDVGVDEAITDGADDGHAEPSRVPRFGDVQYTVYRADGDTPAGTSPHKPALSQTYKCVVSRVKAASWLGIVPVKLLP